MKDKALSPLNKAMRLALFSTAAVMATSPFAISTAVAAEEDQGEKIVITGSRIKRVDVEGPSPIISISKQDMDKQGYATVADVIDGLAQNSGGTLDQSFTFGFTPAASTVNLRGLGVGRTLILIDGRRLPIYPTGVSGTTNFVNLSSIPTAIVERIDILTGGASAIYGSDAVAGVINVITRKDVEGGNIEIRASGTSDGGAAGSRINFLAGVTSGNTHVDFIIDYFRQNPLKASSRDYAGSDTANPRGNYSIGGSTFLRNDGITIEDPNCGTPNDGVGGLGQPNNAVAIFAANNSWCGFDRTAFRQLIAPQENASMVSRIEHSFDNGVTMNARFGLSRNEVNPQLEPNFYGGGVFTGTGTLVPNNGGFVPAGALNNPTTGSGDEIGGFFVRRLVEYGPRSSDIDANGQNALISFDGTFGDGAYDWDVGYMYANTDITNRRGNIILSALNSAVENGLDLFQQIPQSVVDATSFNSIRYSKSSLKGLDFTVTGDTGFELEGGAVGFAVHGESLKEGYDDSPDPLTISGQGFDGASAGGGKREHIGLGVEVLIPLLDNFTITAAARYDDYDDDSDTGSATSPRISFEYRPTDEVLVRASWGESFRAPDMQRLFGATTRGFITLTDPFNGGATVQSVNTLTGSNISLEEEEGENWGLGVVWEVTDGLNISADWFDISLENIIATPTSQFILNQCFGSLIDPNNPFTTDANGIQRANGTHVLCNNIAFDGTGQLQGNAASISATAQNLSLRETDGLDLAVDYKWSTEIGEFDTNLTLTWINNFTTQFDSSSAPVENIGLGALPEYRLNLVQNWNSGDWNATVRVSYIDEVAGQFCTGPCLDNEFIDSYTTINASTSYDFGDWGRVRFGINNLLAEEPPEDPTQNNWPWFFNSGGYYNAKDREGYVQWNVNF